MPAPNIRRSPRIPIQLDIWLQRDGGELHYKTKDVSERGIFIVCLNPLSLRSLVRFRTLVDEEHVQLFGLVSHRVDPAESQERNQIPGMGLQIFPVGLHAAQIWKRVVGRLYSRDPEVQAQIQEREVPVVRIAADDARVREIAEVDVPEGRSFCRTPEVHPVGTTLVCEIVRVGTDETFALPAIVAGVVEGSPRDRGLELVFHTLTEETVSGLSQFAGASGSD